jgi:phage protein D
MSNIKDLTVAQLKRAVEIREEIESLQAQLASIGGEKDGEPAVARAAKPGKLGKRRMSAAGRARIAAAAKARWAKFRRGTATTLPAKIGGRKKRFNAAARAKLSAAAKARWAKAKAAGKSAL